MGDVVYASVPPVAPAGSEPVTHVGIGHTLTGWDGSVWDLMDPTSGVFLLQQPITGMGESVATRWSSTAPYVPGSRYRGTQILERSVLLAVGVMGGTHGDWMTTNRAFRSILRRDKPLTWTVSLPDVGTFTLTCRFDGQPQPLDAHTASLGWVQYDVVLVADTQPYWCGDLIEVDFASGALAPFFPVGGGPPFTISQGNSMASATVTNPGDVDCWPTWTFYDAFTAISVTVDGFTVGVIPDLVSGDVLVIDTSPRAQSATLNGTRVRGILSPHDFAPIPAGATTPITFAWTGTGSAACSIVPLFERLL